MIAFLLLLACSEPQPESVGVPGWREIPAPRPDLQCWTWFSMHVVCAQSLTSTHGASQ